jgi:hypothetical protein
VAVNAGKNCEPTLTAMMYAIVKNVVSPARISVMNFEPFRSFGWDHQSMSNSGSAKLTCPDPSSRKTLPNVDFDIFESRDVIVLSADSIVTEVRVYFSAHGENVDGE